MKTATVSSLALSFALLGGACVDESTDPGAQEFRASWYCNTCGSNSNSPNINSYQFPELNMDQLANESGVVLRGILSPANVLYKLEVLNDDMVAVNAQGVAVATGLALVGWRLYLVQPNGTRVYVTINAFSPDIASWATGATAISGYALSYVPTGGGDPVNVCPGYSANQIAVTLINGETYDRDLKTVNADMPRWFTIACWEEATYKMKRMNYGPNDKFNGTIYPATVAQRQATLKMITADYCGTGESYTEQGTPLVWKNYSNTVNNTPKFYISPPTQEAYWNENGAFCLTEPRLVPIGDVACNLPVCPSPYLGAYEWRTRVP